MNKMNGITLLSSESNSLGPGDCSSQPMAASNEPTKIETAGQCLGAFRRAYSLYSTSYNSTPRNCSSYL